MSNQRVVTHNLMLITHGHYVYSCAVYKLIIHAQTALNIILFFLKAYISNASCIN